MIKVFFLTVAFSWLVLASAIAANAPEVTACSILSSADARRLVGGELDVQEFAKIPNPAGAGSYDSVCTYIAKGGSFQNPVGANRFLDVTLHFLNSADDMFHIGNLPHEKVINSLNLFKIEIMPRLQ